MLLNDVEAVLEKYARWFALFEEYDRTGVWPLARRRVDLTLSERTLALLRERAKARGTSVSRVVDELVEGIA